jgi:glutathione synthase/RimK-type ligase-like ATP-grasp enzyme
MHRIGLANAMSAGWLEEFRSACKSAGLDCCDIVVGRDDWMHQLEGVDAFIWRPVMGDPSNMAEIRTKIPLIEMMGIPCFPNSLMLWLYDDKIRESLFMRRHGYPTPETLIIFDENEAKAYAQRATYPLVTKTHMGASSSGVKLLRSASEAGSLLDRVFAKRTLWDRAMEKYYYIPRLAKGDFLLERRYRYRDYCPRYAYFQEFIKADGDWRITTLGRDLVSVFVRHNRPLDFRASGSGLWEKVTEEALPAEACDLALDISNRHGFTCMTYDFMQGPKGWVIGEISFAFVLNGIYSDTLFRRTESGYRYEAPIAIGKMHLDALSDAIALGGSSAGQLKSQWVS